MCVWAGVFPDSSQNDSFSDEEDYRPGFSMPSISSFDAQDTDTPTEASSKFSMYNSVSQKLMVMCLKSPLLTVICHQLCITEYHLI